MREDNVAVYFIGAGPGDPDLITVRGRELISRADLVLYAGSLVPKEVLAATRNDARVKNSTPLSLEETHALIMDTVRAGGLAVRVLIVVDRTNDCCNHRNTLEKSIWK